MRLMNAPRKCWVAAVLLAALSGLGACSHRPPNLRGELWAGSAAAGGVERKQTHEVIKATDPAMDALVCQKYESLQALIQACKEWY